MESSWGSCRERRSASRQLEIIPAADAQRWEAILAEAADLDCYHLARYHLLAERRGEGKGILMVYREGQRMAAWPFLLRPVATVPGLEGFDGLYDASSVYGYPGPVGSPGAAHDEGFCRRFAASVQDAAQGLGLVSLFSRLNPFVDSLGLTRGLGTVRTVGETVWVDLSARPEEQWSAYRTNHQRDVAAARQRGLAVHRDAGWQQLDDFVRLYRTTMQRVGADSYYFFDKSYFLELREALGDRLQLFVARLGDAVPSAALAIHGGATVHYHLGGSDPGFRELAAMKTVLDEMRLWGCSTGARALHLGGGVGCRQDSLFRFKAGFSPLRRQYRVWSHIVQPEVYERLSRARRGWLARQGLAGEHAGFFPEYRAGPSGPSPAAQASEREQAPEPASTAQPMPAEVER